jgi:peroxiredoxin
MRTTALLLAAALTVIGLGLLVTVSGAQAPSTQPARHKHEDVKPLAIGSAAPDFDLPGVDEKRYSLKDFAAAKVLAIIFTCDHCPTAQAYEQRMMQLQADYKDKGVAVVAINPNDPNALRLDELSYTDLSDSLDEMKIRAKERGFTFPYLYDGDTQKTAHAYGCLATPHVFIFDADRKLRYEGRIDDGEVKPPKRNDAREALDALLADKPVAVETTNVFGCSTKWTDKTDSAHKAIEKWDAEPVTLATIDAAGVKALAAFDVPDSAKETADAKQGISSGRAGRRLRLINVWATWCGPCVIELPDLVTIQRMYRRRGLDVITISMDDIEKKDGALEMLKSKHVAATNYVYSADDKDALVSALDNEWHGPVPHTILVAPGGEVLYRQTGAFDPLELKKAIVAYLGRTY